MIEKIYKLICLPRSIFLNFLIFEPSVACRFPLLINNSVKLKGIKADSIVINGKPKRFMIKLGFGGSESIIAEKSHIILGKNCKLIFDGEAIFAPGIKIVVKNNNLTFGRNFYSNKNLFISSDNNIKFLDDVLIGWNVNIRDTDGHKIIKKDDKKLDCQVIIGNHVWICSYVDVLKGTKIGDNSVIAYRSCCTGINCTNNTLIGGYPAKVLKENINWEK